MFQFNLIITISDVVQAALLVIAGIGIYLTIRQLRQGYEVQKATFFKELYLTLFGDTDVRDAFYLLEYGKFIYDINNLESFENTSNEKIIDRLLSFADLICELFTRKMLTKQEMNSFEYELITIFKHPGIQAYLKRLNDVYKNIGAKTSPFSSFVSYCEKELAIEQVLTLQQK